MLYRRMRVGIMGGGFAGLSLALHLERQAPTGGCQQVAVIEPQAQLGAGVAYSTPFPQHVLNVRHANMSLYADDPGHFSRWLQQAGVDTAFAPRRLYGRYLQDCHLQGQRGCRLQHLRAEVVAVETPTQAGAPAHLCLDDGQRLAVDRVALCTGNRSAWPQGVVGLANLPASLGLAAPWRWDSLGQLPQAGHVFLLGTGLTMVDVLLALQARGFAGRVTAMSRHGLLPQAHRDDAALTAALPLEPAALQPLQQARGPLGLWRAVRQLVGLHQARGGHWQDVVDAMRPLTPQLWQGLTPPQRRALCRHIKAIWDSHRHRLAPAVAQCLAEAQHSQQLQICAGRLQQVQVQDTQLHLQVRRRHGGSQTFQADCLVNCTGQSTDWRRASTPLMHSLAQQQLIRPDSLGLGLDTAASGALIDAAGRASSWLYTLGSTCLGRDFESVAVPELRQQAARLAQAWLQPTAALPGCGRTALP